VGSARIRLHGDLADFTRPATGVRREVPESTERTATFEARPALKDVIEAVGVPHPEVDLVLLDGVPRPLDALAHDGATVDVFPAGAGPAGHARLLPAPRGTPRFLLDGHLGRLASLLRMLGFDTRWERDAPDAALAEASARDDCVLLTRDVGLLKRGVVRRGAFVRSVQPREQVVEVVARFHLRDAARPFSRCIRCNTPLRAIATEDAAPRVPPRVRERHQRFLACDGCGRLYWPGTHHERMRGVVAQVLDQH
jgi:hypothetical protein